MAKNLLMDNCIYKKKYLKKIKYFHKVKTKANKL